MSFLDKIADAVLPAASEEDRREAHRKARGLAGQSRWLTMALDHHERIEQGFADALGSSSDVEAQASVKELATVLVAHSVAEETVLYPTLVIEGHKTQAGMAYQEQQMAKIEMAELERLTPLSQEWRDKLEHIQSAVLQHIYQEENSWFPELIEEAGPSDQALLDTRFAEEFERSVGKAYA